MNRMEMSIERRLKNVNQKVIQELKITTTEIRNLLEGFKDRFEDVEKRIHELEKQDCGIIVFEKLERKRLHKSVQSLGDVWDTSKLSNICIGRAPAGEENVFEK